jgi:hypothetical protein
MKFLFFCLLFFLLISLTSVDAISPSKGKINFDLVVGEELCEQINILSEEYNGKISVRDVWAESPDEKGNLDSYSYIAPDHGISIGYLDVIEGSKEIEDFEICLDADKEGEYKGLIIFSPGTNTNVVVEKAVWLFVRVKEKGVREVVEPLSNTQSPGGSGSSSGSSSSGEDDGIENDDGIEEGVDVLVEVEEDDDLEIEKREIKEDKNAPITGASIGGSKNGRIIISFLAVLIVASIFVRYKRRKK